jgi:hypothetical protein
MCWWRNLRIICHCIARAPSTPARAWNWSAACWPAWVSASSTLLRPLVDALQRHVFAATKLHADDTPLPVLAPGNGKTRTARLWTYMRDDRASGNDAPPAV